MPNFDAVCARRAARHRDFCARARENRRQAQDDAVSHRVANHQIDSARLPHLPSEACSRESRPSRRGRDDVSSSNHQQSGPAKAVQAPAAVQGLRVRGADRRHQHRATVSLADLHARQRRGRRACQDPCPPDDDALRPRQESRWLRAPPIARGGRRRPALPALFLSLGHERNHAQRPARRGRGHLQPARPQAAGHRGRHRSQ